MVTNLLCSFEPGYTFEVVGRRATVPVDARFEIELVASNSEVKVTVLFNENLSLFSFLIW